MSNAVKVSTYLYGPDSLFGEIKVEYCKAVALETALHHALAETQLDVDILAANGRMFKPRVWLLESLKQFQEITTKMFITLKSKQ